MKHQLIALINKEINFGLGVNALAQMSLGLGHQIHGCPDIKIFFGATQQVRQFKQLAAKKAESGSTLYSAFPHTMQGGNTTALWEGILTTPEEKLTYFASCVVTEEIDPEISSLLESCFKLKNYTPYESETETTLIPTSPGINENTAKIDRKTNSLINPKAPLTDALHALVKANLDVGRKTPYDALHLLTIGGLTHLSFNTHPILKSESANKHVTMAQAVEDTKAHPNIISKTEYNSLKQPLVTVAFGPKEEVEASILKKNTRVFDANIEKELVPVNTQNNPENKMLLATTHLTTFKPSLTKEESRDDTLTKTPSSLKYNT